MSSGPKGLDVLGIPANQRAPCSHGYNLLLLERRAFLQCLYDGLPDKSYIRTGCEVRSIKHLDSGVEVTLKDGSVEKGDMVLGCDGVHSKTRSLMWQHADATAPGLITEKEKTGERPCLFLQRYINS